MEVDISIEEEVEDDCETIEDDQEAQALVDVEEIDVEIEKIKKGNQVPKDSEGKIYVECDNCGKSLTKGSLAKHKRLVRCNPKKPGSSKVEQEEEEALTQTWKENREMSKKQQRANEHVTKGYALKNKK